MTRQAKPKSDAPEQSRRFIDMAREVKADESPDAMDRAFDRVVNPKNPKTGTQERKRAGRRD